jgi:hypothetical protein
VRIDPRHSTVIALVLIVTVIVVPMGVRWIQLGAAQWHDPMPFYATGLIALILLGIGVSWVVRITRDTE